MSREYGIVVLSQMGRKLAAPQLAYWNICLSNLWHDEGTIIGSLKDSTELESSIQVHFPY